MNRERQVRDALINSRYIAFTPSRYNNGHRLTNYDDRYSFLNSQNTKTEILFFH
jgi:hypothetical protein